MRTVKAKGWRWSGVRGVALLALASFVAATEAMDANTGALNARWRTHFARPSVLPMPADNPSTRLKVGLGARLFHDPKLSSNGKVACASCHNLALGLADGRRQAAGVSGVPLPRHTPTLWNLAWAPLLFWDGRSASLEEQVQHPIIHPDEMAATPSGLIERLRGDDAYVRDFAGAFPADPPPAMDNLSKALAAYVRTLVSPPTRFDRWLAGDSRALSSAERDGFALFVGKAQCVVCHRGFALTDHAFHNTGLVTGDLGRGAVIGSAKSNHAFKTPGLRELRWTAPYLHDGSLATLDEVVRHYARAGAKPRAGAADTNVFTAAERASLVAFLLSLSSDRPPRPSTEAWVNK